MRKNRGFFRRKGAQRFAGMRSDFLIDPMGPTTYERSVVVLCAGASCFCRLLYRTCVFGISFLFCWLSDLMAFLQRRF